MGWIPAAVAIAGTALQLDAQAKEGAAKDREAKENQSLANRAAADAIARGAKEAGQARSNATKLIARQKVAFAASGVDATVGTPADLQVATAGQAELDALTAENNAAREALGFKTYGMRFAQQAQLDASRRQNEMAGTVLGGLGKVAANWPKD